MSIRPWVTTTALAAGNLGFAMWHDYGLSWFIGGALLAFGVVEFGEWREEKRMARDYGARMRRPLSEAERDAVAAWLRDRREGD